MHLTVDNALAQLKDSGKLFLELFHHGSLNIEIYKPQSVDLQQPHDRDEVYIVISGVGEFMSNGNTIHFNPGDFLFVPAGIEHRFIDFSDDFSTWVIFYGPKGGEATKQENLHD